MSNSLLRWIKEDIWNNGAITLQDECGQYVEMDGLISHFGLEELIAFEEFGFEAQPTHWPVS